LPWTYIGGSRELIGAVLADPSLEAQPTSLDEPIAERHPAWIDAAVASALDDALRDGHATLAPQQGGIEITLHRPRRGRTGSITVAGAGSSSTRTLSGDDPDLLDSVRRPVTWSVVDILTKQE